MSQRIRLCAAAFVGLTLALASDVLADGESAKISADDAVVPDQAVAPNETTRKPEAKAGYRIADAIQIPDAPVYRPPKRGKPRMTVGGGSRGSGEGFPALYALAPDHVGRTTSDHPSLFWVIDEAPAAGTQFVFTLIDEEADTPLVEKVIEAPTSAGLRRVRLSDFGARLESGAEYQWSISMSSPGADHSRDVVSFGWIDYLGGADEIAARLAADDVDRSAFIYADEGIWYDALTSLDDSIERGPGSMYFKIARASLLEGAGLGAVAALVRR